MRRDYRMRDADRRTFRRVKSVRYRRNRRRSSRINIRYFSRPAELSRSPLVVVCAGAKAILDLPNTLEYLETCGVPVIGYQTDEFPAFYSRESGLAVNYNAQTPAEIAAIARAHWSLGLETAVLVGNPPPADSALPADKVEKVILQALAAAKEMGIRGAAMTPFLLERVNQLSQGASMHTNLALLRNNARLAAQIARELVVPILPSV